MSVKKKARGRSTEDRFIRHFFLSTIKDTLAKYGTQKTALLRQKGTQHQQTTIWLTIQLNSVGVFSLLNPYRIRPLQE